MTTTNTDASNTTTTLANAFWDILCTKTPGAMFVFWLAIMAPLDHQTARCVAAWYGVWWCYNCLVYKKAGWSHLVFGYLMWDFVGSMVYGSIARTAIILFHSASQVRTLS